MPSPVVVAFHSASKQASRTLSHQLKPRRTTYIPARTTQVHSSTAANSKNGNIDQPLLKKKIKNALPSVHTYPRENEEPLPALPTSPTCSVHYAGFLNLSRSNFIAVESVFSFLREKNQPVRGPGHNRSADTTTAATKGMSGVR